MQLITFPTIYQLFKQDFDKNMHYWFSSSNQMNNNNIRCSV